MAKLSTSSLVMMAATASVSCGLLYWYRQKHSQRKIITASNNNSRKAIVERHILGTQVSAKALGIRVHSISSTKLSLKAPLVDNRNVHGTGFAGSLYALGVLASYYISHEWMIREGLLHDDDDAKQSSGNKDNYQLVAKSGSIRYKRPVRDDTIVATSTLPTEIVMQAFRDSLKRSGKATVTVEGCIMVEEEDSVAVEYAIELCAFSPTIKSKSNP